MWDLLNELINITVKYGLSLTTVLLVLGAMFKNKRFRRWMNPHLPPLLRDEDDLQEIKKDLKLIKAHLGVSISAGSSVTMKPAAMSGKLWPRSSWAVSSIVGSANKFIISRRVKKMKEYLKKLGRTKFQAFLLTTIANVLLFIGYMTGNIQIEGQLSEWMPAVNLIVQLIVSGVYMWVEGSIDREAQKQYVYPVTGGNVNESTPNFTDHGPAR